MSKADDLRTAAPARLARTAMGQRLSGFIYGTIVVLSVIVAEARAYPEAPAHMAAIVAATCVVFWLAHVYAHGLGHSVAAGERVSLMELRRIAQREGSIVEAAVPSVVALMLGALGILSTDVAIWASFGLGLVVLGAQGLVFARLERLGPLASLAVVGANLALGLVLVALKLLLGH
jgi:hypothetical protein